jgi:predicted RNase H-like nuclease (RuvC/YqgF family)
MSFPRTRPKTRGKLPFGYVLNKELDILEAIPGHLEALEETIEMLSTEKLASLRDGVTHIKSKLGPDVSITYQTIKNYMDKLGLSNAKKPYNYHSEVKAQMSARKTVRERKKTVDALTNKLEKAKKTLKVKEQVFKKLDEPKDFKSKTGKVVIAEDIEDLTPSLKSKAVANVIFKANEGPQEDFLAAGETDVLYGGAAGGGKSYAMLVDPLSATLTGRLTGP